MNLLIMGPAGAGKGTFSEKLIKNYEIKHISTGDMLRDQVSRKTELGLIAADYMNHGRLVPSEIVNKMVEVTLGGDECANGYLLDGYPRTIDQAKELEEITERIGRKIDAVLVLEVGIEILEQRITGRRICPKCGAIYHIKWKPTKVEGICDNCGAEVIQRKDDTLEELKVRMDEYYKNTEPVIGFYEERGLVHRIDASGSTEEIFKNIQEILKSIV